MRLNIITLVEHLSHANEAVAKLRVLRLNPADPLNDAKQELALIAAFHDDCQHHHRPLPTDKMDCLTAFCEWLMSDDCKDANKESYALQCYHYYYLNQLQALKIPPHELFFIAAELSYKPPLFIAFILALIEKGAVFGVEQKNVINYLYQMHNAFIATEDSEWEHIKRLAEKFPALSVLVELMVEKEKHGLIDIHRKDINHYSQPVLIECELEELALLFTIFTFSLLPYLNEIYFNSSAMNSFFEFIIYRNCDETLNYIFSDNTSELLMKELIQQVLKYYKKNPSFLLTKLDKYPVLVTAVALSREEALENYVPNFNELLSQAIDRFAHSVSTLKDLYNSAKFTLGDTRQIKIDINKLQNAMTVRVILSWIVLNMKLVQQHSPLCEKLENAIFNAIILHPAVETIAVSKLKQYLTCLDSSGAQFSQLLLAEYKKIVFMYQNRGFDFALSHVQKIQTLLRNLLEEQNRSALLNSMPNPYPMTDYQFYALLIAHCASYSLQAVIAFVDCIPMPATISAENLLKRKQRIWLETLLFLKIESDELLSIILNHLPKNWLSHTLSETTTMAQKLMSRKDNLLARCVALQPGAAYCYFVEQIKVDYSKQAYHFFNYLIAAQSSVFENQRFLLLILRVLLRRYRANPMIDCEHPLFQAISMVTVKINRAQLDKTTVHALFTILKQTCPIYHDYSKQTRRIFAMLFTMIDPAKHLDGAISAQFIDAFKAAYAEPKTLFLIHYIITRMNAWSDDSVRQFWNNLLYLSSLDSPREHNETLLTQFGTPEYRKEIKKMLSDYETTAKAWEKRFFTLPPEPLHIKVFRKLSIAYADIDDITSTRIFSDRSRVTMGVPGLS